MRPLAHGCRLRMERTEMSKSGAATDSDRFLGFPPPPRGIPTSVAMCVEYCETSYPMGGRNFDTGAERDDAQSRPTVTSITPFLATGALPHQGDDIAYYRYWFVRLREYDRYARLWAEYKK